LKLKTFDFQKRAINELFSYLEFSIKNDKKGKTFLLQAPTGSGKTIIMSQFVNNLKQNLNEKGLSKDFAYIWLSIGDGGLESQSQNKFDKYTSAMRTLSFEDLINNKKLNKNEIAFINKFS
jgi:type III restriction enzyme